MKNIYLLAPLILCTVACSQKKEKAAAQTMQPRSRAVTADAFVAKTIALSEDIKVGGSLLPSEVTEIRPEITGRVVSINFKEGTAVKKGALLAKLFDEDLQAQLKKLQVQLEINQKTVERYQSLLKIQGISQQDVDLSELSVNNNKADIELVKVSITKTEIRAPYNGRIGLRNISLGAYVSPTDIIATIRQVDQLKLEFTVPEKYSTDFSAGKKISFSIAGTLKKFEASVMATEYFIDANTRSLSVKAMVKGTDPALVPGAFAEVALDLAKNNNAVIVPTQAIIPLSKGKQVIVVSNGVPKFLPVVTGIRDSVYIQIISGINIGDTVLVSGLMAVKPNSQIQLSKIN